MSIVVSKSAETNAVKPYFVTCLAGPRIGKVRVAKGEELSMTEYQARGLLASGELVADKTLVEDPWSEAVAAKTAADAKAPPDKGTRAATGTAPSASPTTPTPAAT